jgi:hypothetical protein
MPALLSLNQCNMLGSVLMKTGAAQLKLDEISKSAISEHKCIGLAEKPRLGKPRA